MQTHLEPLAEETPGRPPADDVAADRETVMRIVRDITGAQPEELRFVRTDEGLVAYLTLRFVGGTVLADAHARASEIEERDPPRASRYRRRDRAHGAAAVKLCMFSPRDRDLLRGWPGRIDGDRVVQLAAQTLQAFFTGGGEAREHAEFALADVVLRAPVLHPPTVRIFGRTATSRSRTPLRSTGLTIRSRCLPAPTRWSPTCGSPP